MTLEKRKTKVERPKETACQRTVEKEKREERKGAVETKSTKP
jgi:hypothetical protein